MLNYQRVMVITQFHSSTTSHVAADRRWAVWIRKGWDGMIKMVGDTQIFFHRNLHEYLFG
jgi:hypothetical protein